MVSRNPRRKVQKRTYADRVMNAITDIRKRYRKDAVHVSSVKQRVRQNAATEEDKLGPHWQTWVGLTVKDLKTRGVLASTPPRGSISLTAEAKARIAQARRSCLKPVRNGQSAAGGEDLAWREIIRQFPLHDTRYTNASSSSSPPESPKNNSVQDFSTSNLAKPLSKMKKSELYATARSLQEELVKLKSDFAAFASNRSSELGELNLRLLDKEQELKLLKTAADEEGSESDDEVGDTTLVDVPEFVVPHTLRSNAEDVQSKEQIPEQTSITRPSLKRAPEGLERTISGSFIHNISKRPTPAPSEASSDRNSPAPAYLDFEDPDADVDPDQTYVEPDALEQEETEGRKLASFKEGLQLHSPMSTPPVSFRRVADEQREVEMALRQRITKLLEEKLDDRNAFEAKITALETRLESRDVEVRHLEGQLNARTGECKTLQDRLASLQKSQEGLTTLLQQHTSANEQAKQLSEENQSLRQIQEQLESKLCGKELELERCRDELAQKDLKLAQADNDTAELRSLLEKTTNDLEEAQGNRASVSHELESKQQELLATLAQLQAKSQAFACILEESESLNEQVTTMRRELEESQSNVKSLQVDILRLADESTALRVRLESVEALYSTEKVARELAERDLVTAQSKHTEYTDVIVVRLKNLEEKAEKSRLELELARASEQSLHSALGVAVAQVSELTNSLETGRNELNALRDSADDKTKEVVALRSALEGSRQNEHDLQTALNDAHLKKMAVEAEAKELRNDLQQTEGLLETIQSAYERLRRQIDDVDNVIMKASQANKKRKLAADAFVVRDDKLTNNQ